MTKIIVIVLIISGLIHACVGVFAQFGQCSDLPLENNFNITRFQGAWAETWRSGNYGDGTDCSTIDVTEEEDSYVLTNTIVDNNFATKRVGDIQNITGGTVPVLFRGTTEPVQYYVLDIFDDYSVASILYTCIDTFPNIRNLGVHVFLRPMFQPNDMIETNVNLTLSANLGIRLTDLIRVDHSDDVCYTLPVIDSGPIKLPGPCDSPIAYANFAPIEFIGEWHEIASYYSENVKGTCSRAQYSMGTGGVNVKNSQVVNQTLLTISGNATVISDDNSGLLSVTLEVLPGVFETQDLWILDTDYLNYAISYSCVDLPDTNEKIVFSWILGRSSYLPEGAQAAVESIIDSRIDLNQRYYQDTLRSDDDCFYYPEPNGQPVVFRGICDQTIPVMAGFEPDRYLGLWHNIESYPSQFQVGSCVNADYSLGADRVEVLNSQVVNERLLTASGYAIVSDLEPGKLSVGFPIEGTNYTTETDYWVLDTDYDTYALVYTCIDLINRERAVVSWKLSRTKDLTSAANDSIAAIIETIPVLDQRYYLPENQSEDGCFYYPDPIPGVPVVFPGRCDNNITTQTGFDLTQFAGTWYEVEAYPRDEQNRQCIRHEYSESADTLSLVSTQIINQFLTIDNATVKSDPEDSAKLTISFTSNGENIEIPFWILSTDYENYALAYGCVQRNNYFRAIYSWKLSRKMNLTEEDHASINTAIEPVQVLNNTYFELIDHSPDGCFYLPELAPGEPVILVGQCDENIGVIQDFRPDLYEGTWRVISSYPAEFQTGACFDATYTLYGETVEVYNTQVINETLDTITGTAVLASNDSSGKLTVDFPGTPESAQYWILDTDYLTYSLVYSCRNIDSSHRRVWSWKMSRTNELTDAANDKINDVINSVQVLNNRYFTDVNRSREACFYYPVPDGNPLVFRGQCEDIPVMQNFDAIYYQGLWHNVESFPSLTQPGECNNARYTITNGAVAVFNTEVINQTLSTISGVAYQSPIEPAKLVVNFPSVGDEVTDYWILDTDYTSYSLVYTCLNDGPDYRRVWSWKLSRTKELTPEAAETIKDVKKDIQVLDEKYYEPRDQSPEACFYFPDPVPGQPVIFPGQCDQNITTMNNFNMSKFLGRWHEIEAFPTGQYQGDCINHIFASGSGDNVNVKSNRVFDLTLDTATSALNGTGNDGKLSITITTPSGEVTLPFWIIDTDYDDYALAYSCVDNEDDTRNVYSWKLSKHRYLTQNGENGIDAAINNVEVLQDKYYDPVDQTENGCFYLPDLNPGDPVIFPGQCDRDIDVMSNFSALEFLGQWRLISSYPSEFQVGTCNDAYYRLQPDGIIEVFNTEVVNLTLSTINGTAELIGNGRLLVYFPTAPEPIEYLILDTDYLGYSLIYSCVNINDEERQVWSWKLGRSNNFENSSIEAIDKVIGRVNVLDEKYFVDIARDEDDCFYFPEPNNQTVYFRGQCSPTIPVVENFKPDLYKGLWYSIESYPSEFQFGTCPSALYSVNEDTGVIDVYNTQVFNERLDSINATAVFASADGSAKLNVTFPFPGYEVVTPYWVLATDYENYALVYSCVNVNEDYMRVVSWKMSRHRNLTAESESAIEDSMKDIRVVDERYFLPWGHDDDDCWFYPELTDGRVILPGQCADDDIDVVRNFTATDFAGPWREAARFPSEFQTGDCAASRFQLNGNAYTLTKTIVYNERLITMVVPAAFAEDGTGIISASLNNGDGSSFNLNMYILDTDYTNFALVYSCRDIGNSSKQVFSWKLSRTRNGLTPEAYVRINEIVSETRDLFEDYYQYADQSNDACFYYPQFEQLPDSIELPGPCDNRIRAVPNFSVDSFSGRWIETARYPEPEQFGTCNRAHYTPHNEYVAVMNTEVLNSTLRTINGAATLASTDGSGELAVTFTVDGVVRTSKLSILTTDYISYALAYSCRNLENGNRTVTSWKLSRTKTLTPEDNDAIDRVILDTQGLIEEYYVPTSQADEDCFYVPEVDLEQAPLFRGQCEDTVWLQNFDVQRFLGVWHEIESYPRDSSAGDCISSNYETSNNQIVVVDTGIFDVTAQFTTGTVTADTNGRLTRVMTDGTSTFRQDIVVADTDYEHYALLYSCENYDEEYRRVWSGKYSRTRLTEFSAAAQASMDELIEANELLYPQFYQEVNQSDDACFHYPELTGQQVILPGQCDVDIPVVTNFDVVEYSGNWYQMERYPQIHESGTCIGARYTLNENTGVVTVLNWEVIDDELETIEGTAVLLNSTDGSAKLLVSLPITGTEVMVESELYILATDYVTYSLAYSCTNINEHQRAVGAWKLSRLRTMPTPGTTAINEVIAQREELHQPYFISVEQDESCPVPPSSSTLFRSSIIVILLCLGFKMLF